MDSDRIHDKRFRIHSTIRKITIIDLSILSCLDSKDTGVGTQPVFRTSDVLIRTKDPDPTPNPALFASIFQGVEKSKLY